MGTRVSQRQVTSPTFSSFGDEQNERNFAGIEPRRIGAFQHTPFSTVPHGIREQIPTAFFLDTARPIRLMANLRLGLSRELKALVQDARSMRSGVGAMGSDCF